MSETPNLIALAENYLRQLPPHVASREAAQIMRSLVAELTAAQSALREQREKVLEEAEKVCEERANIHGGWKDRADTEPARNLHSAKRFEAIRCATAIRALTDQDSAKEGKNG